MTQVANMPQPAVKPVSTAVLLAFFNDKADKAEVNRLASLVNAFKVSSITDIKEATKGLTEGLKKTDPGYGVAHTRASEARILGGAIVNKAYTPEKVGYHEALREARDRLKIAGIKWSGERIPDKAEKEAKAKRAAEVAAYEAALAERDARINKGEEVTPEMVQALTEANADTLMRERAKRMAAALVKKHGTEYAEVLAESLLDAIHNATAQVPDAEAVAEQAQAQAA